MADSYLFEKALPMEYGELSAVLMINGNVFVCSCELVTVFRTVRYIDSPIPPQCVSEGQLKTYYISVLLKNWHAVQLCDTTRSDTDWPMFYIVLIWVILLIVTLTHYVKRYLTPL